MHWSSGNIDSLNYGNPTNVDKFLYTISKITFINIINFSRKDFEVWEAVRFTVNTSLIKF